MSQQKPTRSELFASRKFLLTLLSIILLTLMCYAGFYFPIVQGILPAFNSGILGILGLYFLGNVTNKYVVGKTINNSQENKINDE